MNTKFQLGLKVFLYSPNLIKKLNISSFTIGGDHTMGLASIAAVATARRARGDTGLIWIDAHADINTPETSPSQALHGMPLAALLGMGDPDYVAVAGVRLRACRTRSS